MDRRTVGILIFDDVEVLDFAGPYEVFSRTRTEPGVESRRTEATAPFRVYTVGKTASSIRATGGLQVTPDVSFDAAPILDIVVVPGGFGTRALLADRATIDWVIGQSHSAEQMTSVCTGALLLAEAGVLKNKRATTHWGALELLSQVDPTISVDPAARVVADGVITSAGVAAGMDMAFSVVARFCGTAVARETARYIEYPWEG